MAIRVLAVGRKHESWVSEGIERYAKRLKKPFDLSWQLIAHSARQDDAARAGHRTQVVPTPVPCSQSLNALRSVGLATPLSFICAAM